MSVLILLRYVHPSLTGGGGLAGVDVSDDDDVDMSLFLTKMIEDMSEMLIDIKERTILRSAGEISYPMVAVVSDL